MKKIHGIILASALTLSAAGAAAAFMAPKDIKPAKAELAGTYMCGVDVSDHWQLYKDDDHYARWVYGTLTLKNFDNTDPAYQTYISGKKGGDKYSNSGVNVSEYFTSLFYINSVQDVTMLLYGENKLTQTKRGNNIAHVGINFCSANGKYSLTIEGADENASLTIQAADSSSAGRVSSGINVSDSSGLRIKNATVVSKGGASSNSSSNGISFYGNWVDVESGSLTALGGNGVNSYGISSSSTASTVNVKGGELIARGGTATTESVGVSCGNNFSVTGGRATVEGNNYGYSYITNNGTLNIGENAKFFRATGGTKASKRPIKNAIPGAGWNTVDASDTSAPIQVNTSGATLDYKRVEFKQIDYTASCGEYNYTGSEQVAPVSIKVNDPASGYEITYKKQSDTEYSSTIPSFSDVGTHKVDFKITAPNYPDAYGTVDCVMSPAAISNPSVTVTSEQFVYDGQPKQVTVSTSAETVDGSAVTFTYSYSETGTYKETIDPQTDAGTYTVYWKASAENHSTATGSFTYTIAPNKAALEAKIAEADVYYNSIKDSYPAIAEELKAVIDAAKAVDSDEAATQAQVEQALADLIAALEKAQTDTRDVVTDEETGVTIKTEDGTGISPSITLKVNVKSDSKSKSEVAKNEAVKSLLEPNQRVKYVYDIKLVKTVGDEEVEVNPSDIKIGMKIIVSINLPKDVNAKSLGLVQVRSEESAKLIEDFEVENGVLTFEVSSLGQIALLQKVNVISGGAIAGIVIGSIVLLLGLAYVLLFFVFNRWIRKEDKAVRVLPFALGKKDEKKRLLAFPCKIEYRNENEIFKTKQEALK